MHLGNWEHARLKTRSNSAGLNRNIRNVVTVWFLNPSKLCIWNQGNWGADVVCGVGVFLKYVHQHLSPVPA